MNNNPTRVLRRTLYVILLAASLAAIFDPLSTWQLLWLCLVIGALLLIVSGKAINGPDMNIGPDYLHRWYVIPRNRWFNIYLHHILRDDDPAALHDHPWHSVSFLLRGKLREITPDGVRYPRRFVPVFRAATHAHRLEVPATGAWTLFITGPRIREWGFHCPRGWVHWQEFTAPDDYGRVGKGCGEHD